MRSGCLKSRIAAPSRRNSGLEATATSAVGLASRMMRSTSSPVPTGTVDLVTTTVKPRQRGGDLARGGMDIAQVGMAVAAPRRRADRDEHGVGLGAPAPARSVVKSSRPGLDVGGDQLVEARLVDRDLAALQRRDLAGVLVDAGDVVAEIGKAGAGHKADIAGADHCDAHEKTFIIRG